MPKNRATWFGKRRKLDFFSWMQCAAETGDLMIWNSVGWHSYLWRRKPPRLESHRKDIVSLASLSASHWRRYKALQPKENEASNRFWSHLKLERFALHHKKLLEKTLIGTTKARHKNKPRESSSHKWLRKITRVMCRWSVRIHNAYTWRPAGLLALISDGNCSCSCGICECYVFGAVLE